MSLPMPKKLRSQPPDVIVSVGSGDNKQEFECYKAVLSFASPYFDAMFSSNMVEDNENRVSFPNKDPEEWKLFCKYVEHNDSDIATDKETAITLTPWFHELQMENSLRECDEVLAGVVRVLSKGKDETTWADISRRDENKENFKGIVEMLQLSCTYDLKKTKIESEDFIRFLYDIKEPTYFTRPRERMEELIDLFLPLEKEEYGDDDDAEWVATGKSSVFWQCLQETIFDVAGAQTVTGGEQFSWNFLRGLSHDDVNDNRLLPRLVESFMYGNKLMHLCANQDKHMKDTTEKLAEMLSTFLEQTEQMTGVRRESLSNHIRQLRESLRT